MLDWVVGVDPRRVAQEGVLLVPPELEGAPGKTANVGCGVEFDRPAEVFFEMLAQWLKETHQHIRRQVGNDANP